MMYYVYKLTDKNNKSYIGITLQSRLKTRMAEHFYSKRFDKKLFTQEILAESDSYESALILEKQFIKEHDTYKNGLNSTPDGTGQSRSPKFTTLGFKYSAESRLRMSLVSKGKPKYALRGRKLSPDRIKAMSKSRKNIQSNSKLTRDEVITLLLNFYNDSFDTSSVGVIQKNGKAMSREQAYALNIHNNYNVTPQCVKRILLGQTWNGTVIKKY